MRALRRSMSPSGRIISAIGGDKAQRESAYVSLVALARGDNADVAATVGSATLHVSGALAELDEESRLADVFGKFGSVLAVTLRREGASLMALLTFAEVEDARSAVAAGVAGVAESLGVSWLEVGAVDTQQGILGSSMGEAMRQHQERVSEGVAVACVGPFMNKIFGADESVIDATECALCECFPFSFRNI
eukprot:COSAG05_NODE_1175_length_5616_cov_2.565343_1_plen_191_part_00